MKTKKIIYTVTAVFMLMSFALNGYSAYYEWPNVGLDTSNTQTVLYGAKKEVAGLTGQCLHAVGLRFLHPRTHEVMELSCPLPEEFTRMLQKIRK